MLSERKQCKQMLIEQMEDSGIRKHCWKVAGRKVLFRRDREEEGFVRS